MNPIPFGGLLCQVLLRLPAEWGSSPPFRQKSWKLHSFHSNFPHWTLKPHLGWSQPFPILQILWSLSFFSHILTLPLGVIFALKVFPCSSFPSAFPLC